MTSGKKAHANDTDDERGYRNDEREKQVLQQDSFLASLHAMRAFFEGRWMMDRYTVRRRFHRHNGGDDGADGEVWGRWYVRDFN